MRLKGMVMSIVRGQGKDGVWAKAQIWDVESKQLVGMYVNPESPEVGEGEQVELNVQVGGKYPSVRLVKM